MTDYPDWQTYPNAQSDNVFAAFSQTLTPGAHPGAIMPCVNWASVMIIVQPSAGAGQVQIGHFADALGTQQIDSDTWPVNANTALIVRTPLRGKFMRITITVTSAVNMVTQTWAEFLSTTSDRISFPVSQQNISDFAHALAANAQIIYSVGEISAGFAQFFFTPYDTAAKLQVTVLAVDELGNTGQLIAEFGQPAATINQLITVPDVIVSVLVINKDAVNPHTYDFSLTIPPQ